MTKHHHLASKPPFQSPRRLEFFLSCLRLPNWFSRLAGLLLDDVLLAQRLRGLLKPIDSALNPGVNVLDPSQTRIALD